MNSFRGSSDKPIESIENDEFSIRPYAEGIAEYIKDCETPMTIAIQGEWGCGKTSMMHMVCSSLTDDIIPVWFNTWQFSQFNRDKDLPITFLNHLVDAVAPDFNAPSAQKEAATKIKSILSKLLVGTLSHFIGNSAGEAVKSMIDEIPNKADDYASEISELKENFDKLISNMTKAKNKRIVFFIDDLDRLSPIRAIELLEALKIFIDCENCVFVMAIDTSVVFQGIREKYGHDLSESKAQNYFDKMIQLPFKMPVESYQLRKMLDRLLNFFLDEKIINQNEWEKYIGVLRHATDGNPRSIKRLVNSMLLLNKVAIKKGLYTEQPSEDKSLSVRLLFILTCIQHKYPKIHEFILKNNTGNNLTKLSKVNICENASSNIDKIQKELNELGVPLPELDVDERQGFIELCYPLIKLLDTYLSKDTKYVYKIRNIISLNPISSSNGNNDDVKSEVSQNRTQFYQLLVVDKNPDKFFELLKNEEIYLPSIKRRFNSVFSETSADIQKSLQENSLEFNELDLYPQFSYIKDKIDDLFSDINYIGKELRCSIKVSDRNGKPKTFYLLLSLSGYRDLVIRMDFPAELHKLECRFEFDKMMSKIRNRYAVIDSILGDTFLNGNSNLKKYSAEVDCKSVSFEIYDLKTAKYIVDFITYIYSSPDCFSES